jgi:tetratricopeptide (TPR) repeat protein
VTKSLTTILCVIAFLSAGGALAGPDEHLVRGGALTRQGDDLAQATALNHQVVLFYQRGRYEDAIPLAKEVIAILEKVRGPDHPDVAAMLNTLAELYTLQGRYAEAEPLYERSLAIKEKMLGPDHPDVALSLNDMAVMYDRQGRYAEAEPLYKRSLAIREKVLGPDHPDVALGLNNLALLYDNETRYAEAEPLFKRSLAIFEKAFGPDHPKVALGLNNLAALYRLQGRYAEAEPLYKRSLAINEKALGPDHPDVALGLNNLAELYRLLGRFAEAEPLYQRSLGIREKALGPDHPDVAQSLNDMAVMYDRQRRYAEAEPLYKRSLAIREKAPGPDHPDVALALNNLAELYRKQDHFAEAEPLYQRSLAIIEKALGPDHPDVALGLNNLAELYREQERYDEALTFSRRAVAILERRFAEYRPRSDGGDERRSNRFVFVNNVSLIASVGAPMETAESFRVAQLAGASRTAATVADMAARFADGSDALAGVVREWQGTAQRWQTLDKAIIVAASQPPAQRNVATEDALRKEFAETDAQLDALDARIAKEFPAYAELGNPKPLELSEVQALLASDEAMLVYLVGDNESWLWVLRKDRAQFLKLGIGGKALSDEVSELRSKLAPGLNPDPAPSDAKRARELYQQIVVPAASALDGARQIFLVPDGPLESLPFGVLAAKAPPVDQETAADRRDIAQFARDNALTVLPSIGALKELRQIGKSSDARDPFVRFAASKIATLIRPNLPTR